MPAAAEGTVREAQDQSGVYGSDHRKHPRLECGGVADLRVLPYGAQEYGALLNLSRRGCCFLAELPLRGVYGSRIEVHMKVRGIDVRVVGVMRHVHNRVRAGIEFVSLTDRKRAQIDELIDELTELDRRARQAQAEACRLHELEHLGEKEWNRCAPDTAVPAAAIPPFQGASSRQDGSEPQM